MTQKQTYTVVKRNTRRKNLRNIWSYFWELKKILKIKNNVRHQSIGNQIKFYLIRELKAE